MAFNGNGIETKNENDLSVACKVSFHNFDAFLGGDLSGFNQSPYKDIETSVAPKVGQVEVYKVSHHGSQYSSNEQFLRTLKPEIGIISVGTRSTGNTDTYRHPRAPCLARLHTAGINTYWTEKGNGVSAEPGHDIIGGNIIVEVKPRSDSFSVTYSNHNKDIYPMWEPFKAAPSTGSAKYAWSKKSSMYHYITCRFVDIINSQNYQSGSTPPEGKTLHEGCPVK